ncbi:glycosyltransferase, partial [bacterium]|nr:glycosyltransferase [bacterium]
MTHAPTRILFVLPSFAGGGAERVALTLLASLDPTSFSPALAVLDNRGPLADMVPEGTPVTDLETPRLRRALVPLVLAIRKAKPDIVFSTLGYVNLALLAAQPFLPQCTRIVVREANMPSLSLPNTSHPASFKTAHRFLYPRADIVICTSEQMAEEMGRDFTILPANISLLPNPVDEVAVRRAAAPIERAR